MIDHLRPVLPFAPVDMPQFQPTLPDNVLVSTLSSSSSIKTFRVLVSAELQPIETLQGVEFLKAFFQIERCHYEMWNRHNDLSLANLMYRVVGEQKVGVLSNWDLRDATDERDKTMLERVGTVPYKSLDLLDNNPRSDDIPHLYRHDLEAFVWILVWTVLCHAENKRREIYFDRQTWLRRDQADVCQDKCAFLFSLEYVLPSPSRAQEWTVAQGLLEQLMVFRLNRMMKRKKGIVEKDPREVAYLHWEAIQESELEDALKEVILASKPRF